MGGRSATPEAVGTTFGWTRTVSPTSLWYHPVEPLPRLFPGRKSIKLESSPTEGEGIHCPRPRFRFPGHKWGKLAVQSACKEAKLWNKGEEGRKLFEHHRVKHPFIIVPKILGMKICHGVLNARDEGSRQPNVSALCPMPYRQSNLIARGGVQALPLPLPPPHFINVSNVYYAIIYPFWQMCTML